MIRYIFFIIFILFGVSAIAQTTVQNVKTRTTPRKYNSIARNFTETEFVVNADITFPSTNGKPVDLSTKAKLKVIVNLLDINGNPVRSLDVKYKNPKTGGASASADKYLSGTQNNFSATVLLGLSSYLPTTFEKVSYVPEVIIIEQLANGQEKQLFSGKMESYSITQLVKQEVTVKVNKIEPDVMYDGMNGVLMDMLIGFKYERDQLNKLNGSDVFSYRYELHPYFFSNSGAVKTNGHSLGDFTYKGMASNNNSASLFLSTDGKQKSYKLFVPYCVMNLPIGAHELTPQLEIIGTTIDQVLYKYSFPKVTINKPANYKLWILNKQFKATSYYGNGKKWDIDIIFTRSYLPDPCWALLMGGKTVHKSANKVNQYDYYDITGDKGYFDNPNKYITVGEKDKFSVLMMDDDDTSGDDFIGEVKIDPQKYLGKGLQIITGTYGMASEVMIMIQVAKE